MLIKLKPSNNALRILTEMHETPLSGWIYTRTKWNKDQRNLYTNSPDLGLSNKYLEMIMILL